MPVTKVYLDDDYMIVGHADGTLKVYGAERLNLIAQINLSVETLNPSTTKLTVGSILQIPCKISFIARQGDFVISTALDPETRQFELSVWALKGSYSVNPLQRRAIAGNVGCVQFDRTQNSAIVVTSTKTKGEIDISLVRLTLEMKVLASSLSKWKSTNDVDQEKLAMELMSEAATNSWLFKVFMKLPLSSACAEAVAESFHIALKEHPDSMKVLVDTALDHELARYTPHSNSLSSVLPLNGSLSNLSLSSASPPPQTALSNASASSTLSPASSQLSSPFLEAPLSARDSIAPHSSSSSSKSPRRRSEVRPRKHSNASNDSSSSSEEISDASSVSSSSSSSTSMHYSSSDDKRSASARRSRRSSVSEDRSSSFSIENGLSPYWAPGSVTASVLSHYLVNRCHLYNFVALNEPLTLLAKSEGKFIFSLAYGDEANSEYMSMLKRLTRIIETIIDNMIAKEAHLPAVAVELLATYHSRLQSARLDLSELKVLKAGAGRLFITHFVLSAWLEPVKFGITSKMPADLSNMYRVAQLLEIVCLGGKREVHGRYLAQFMSTQSKKFRTWFLAKLRAPERHVETNKKSSSKASYSSSGTAGGGIATTKSTSSKFAGLVRGATLVLTQCMIAYQHTILLELAVLSGSSSSLASPTTNSMLGFTLSSPSWLRDGANTSLTTSSAPSSARPRVDTIGVAAGAAPLLTSSNSSIQTPATNLSSPSLNSPTTPTSSESIVTVPVLTIRRGSGIGFGLPAPDPTDSTAALVKTIATYLLRPIQIMMNREGSKDAGLAAKFELFSEPQSPSSSGFFNSSSSSSSLDISKRASLAFRNDLDERRAPKSVRRSSNAMQSPNSPLSPLNPLRPTSHGSPRAYSPSGSASTPKIGSNFSDSPNAASHGSHTAGYDSHGNYSPSYSSCRTDKLRRATAKAQRSNRSAGGSHGLTIERQNRRYESSEMSSGISSRKSGSSDAIEAIDSVGEEVSINAKTARILASLDIIEPQGKSSSNKNRMAGVKYTSTERHIDDIFARSVNEGHDDDDDDDSDRENDLFASSGHQTTTFEVTGEDHSNQEEDSNNRKNGGTSKRRKSAKRTDISPINRSHKRFASPPSSGSNSGSDSTPTRRLTKLLPPSPVVTRYVTAGSDSSHSSDSSSPEFATKHRVHRNRASPQTISPDTADPKKRHASTGPIPPSTIVVAHHSPKQGSAAPSTSFQLMDVPDSIPSTKRSPSAGPTFGIKSS